MDKPLVLVRLLDVLRNELLEGLELREQLVRRDLALDRVAGQEERRGFDRALPADFVGRRGSCAFVGERLDLVEVDVREAVSLGLVELDPRPAPLGSLGSRPDLLAEGRVLAALIVADDEAGVPGPGLRLLDGGNPQAAYNLLSPLQSQRAGDPDYDYLLGVSALDLGKNGAIKWIVGRTKEHSHGSLLGMDESDFPKDISVTWPNRHGAINEMLQKGEIDLPLDEEWLPAPSAAGRTPDQPGEHAQPAEAAPPLVSPPQAPEPSDTGAA